MMPRDAFEAVCVFYMIVGVLSVVAALVVLL